MCLRPAPAHDVLGSVIALHNLQQRRGGKHSLDNGMEVDLLCPASTLWTSEGHHRSTKECIIFALGTQNVCVLPVLNMTADKHRPSNGDLVDK